VDLPQTLLEPILVRNATLNGFNCRFDTTFVSFTQDEEGVLSTLKDNISGALYQIRSKYLFGADGARSEVFRQLELPLDVRPDQGVAYNVHLKADLSSYMRYRTGNLHWLLQPDKEHPLFGWACIARMVRPWDEWLFIVLPERGKELETNPSNEQWEQRMKEFIGDDSISTEILGVSKWRINDVVAKKFSKGRV
jgi:2-polyprenyl-6-methoxyphenol hydroxylase-like FAD-dependent oxidoreductase